MSWLDGLVVGVTGTIIIGVIVMVIRHELNCRANQLNNRFKWLDDDIKSLEKRLEALEK